MVFEVVLENVAEAKLAEKYGAKRIELCSGLDLGGLTPGAAIIQACVQQCNLEVHVMIRPRTGGFIYNEEEVNIMEQDIILCAGYGCKGVVFGLLKDNYSIDIPNTKKLTDKAKSLGLEVTFHRAIDFSNNIFVALEDIISCGADRILTAGDTLGVDTGMDNIKRLKDISGGRIQVMAGGGVSQINTPKLLETGVDALHFNVRKKNEIFNNPAMGNEYDLFESKIEEIVNLF